MIFPGMDPYLENPHLWKGVHMSLIVYMGNQLQPLLQPRFVAGIEERVYVAGTEQTRVPDVLIKRTKKKHGAVAVLEADRPVVVKVPEQEVHEPFITILDKDSEFKVVTVIELVSPANKTEGAGRRSYVAKQQEVRQSDVHLVEIDLLRTGRHVLAVDETAARAQEPYDYLACVNRAVGERDVFDLYPRTLHDRLPRIGIPLSGRAKDVVLDLQKALEKTYHDGYYHTRLRYHLPCTPPLTIKDQVWANELITKALNRNGRNGRRRTKA